MYPYLGGYMKPIIIEHSRIPKMLSWVINIWAITLWPFIICKGKMDAVDKCHESIHIKQQGELLVVFFYLIYAWDWIVGLIKYKDKEIAYEQIRFEQEAYKFELELKYPKKRKLYAWRKYKV